MEILAGIFVVAGAIAVGLLASVILVAWRGMALAVLWGWFLVPLGLPMIGIAHALGIAIVFALLQGDVSRNTKHALLGGILTPLLAIAAGYVITLFM
jgi:hypothetical protein